MFNQELLKTITLLYVEDEERIRTTMYNIFVKLFKNVYIAQDGHIGLELFKQLSKDNIHIDVVVADINMPIMNGLDMLEQIKNINSDIPFVLTTAHAETDYLLRAIELNVRHYAVKPLQIKDVMLQIQDICEAKFNEKIIKKQQLENIRYVNIINQAAIVTKTDLDGKIIFVNDMFCDVSGYTQKELIGRTHNIVRHPDMPNSFFKKLWDTLTIGETWKGKIKNKTKDGISFVVSATIFPIFDDIGETILEYMSVMFLITEDEEERRLFHHKVVQNMSEQRQREYELTKQLELIQKQLKYSSHDNVTLLTQALESEKQKNIKMKNQLSHYEKELKQENNRYNGAVTDAKNKIGELSIEKKELKEEIQSYKDKLITIQNELTDKSKEIAKLSESVSDQATTIKNLKDVIKHREDELKKLKEAKKK